LLITLTALLSAGLSWAGTNNFAITPASPGSADSAMYTLEDIFQKLNMPGTNVVKRVGAFAGPPGGPTNGTMHTLDDIMDLVTNRVPVAKTGQTTQYQAGDDGDMQAGVAWPSPRFVTNSVAGSEVVILDRLTGLMWTKDANLAGTKSLANAITSCNDLNYGGYDDWRLPNAPELLSLVDHGRSSPALQAEHPFINVANSTYWSSSFGANDPAGLELSVNMTSGSMNGYDSGGGKTGPYYSWPVRGGP